MVRRGAVVDIAATLAEIETLSVEERLRIVEAIWDSIAAEPENLPLTDAQRDEMDRRLADDLANPDAGIPWEEVMARALTRARR
jgi:putative addiction module component (TIGR02574 family)